MMKNLFSLAALAAACALLLVACSGEVKEKTGKRTVTLSGAFAIYPTAVAWADEYEKLHPGVKVEVSAGGAGKGAADCMAGLVDIGMVSRDPDPAELAKGVNAVTICHDGVFVIINEKNPYADELVKRGLTRAALLDMYKNGAKADFETLVKKEGGTSTTAVNIYTRSDSCGAAATFAKFLGNLKQEELGGIGVNSDPQMINAVMNDVNGISYTNFSYVFGRDGAVIEGVRVVPIDSDENGTTDEGERIASRSDAVSMIEKGTYPIARRNFFFFKGAPAGPAKDFLVYCLSEEGTKVLEQVGTSLPMPKEQREKVLEGLK